MVSNSVPNELAQGHVALSRVACSAGLDGISPLPLGFAGASQLFGLRGRNVNSV